MDKIIEYKARNHRGLPRLLMILFLLIFHGNLFAIDFEVNGITYNISALTNTNVKVTGKTNSYTGSIVIPEKVSYQGKTVIKNYETRELLPHKTLLPQRANTCISTC